jgi:tripartite-type tricarboxylate transporter receptor subunit TctC
VAPALYSKVAYHPVKSFVPVSAVSLETLALLVNPAVPANNVRELVAYLKANPGKMNFGTPGNGTQTHLVSEMFRQVAGVDTTHIPYKGGAPSVVAAMSGEVQYLFNPMSTSLSVFKSGKLRLIAVTGLQRDALAPAIPTVAESGYPGFEALFWIGIVAPAATPRAVVELLGNESQKILRTPEMKETLAKLGSSPFITSSADFGKLIGSEFEKWSALAAKANIKPE